MAGKRLLDAALLLNATRNIAKQHAWIRGEQFDAWSKTSTIAKAVKTQTDRVTLTAQAAAAIARRLNEQTPPPAESTNKRRRTDGGNSTNDVRPFEEHETSQWISTTSSAPHGFAPPSTGSTKGIADPDFLLNQRASIAPNGPPLTTDRPIDEETLEPKSAEGPVLADFNQRTATELSHNASENDEVPDGIDTNVFHTPRGKQLLGKEAGIATPGARLDARESKSTQLGSKPAEQGKDRDTASVRMTASQHGSEPPSNTIATRNQNGEPADESVQSLATDIAQDQQSLEAGVSQNSDAVPQEQDAHLPFQMHESRVPSSRIGRLWQYAGLGTSMAFGVLGESFRRATGGNSEGSLMLSAGNMERLVAKLSRMRGAALKLGQMISFQDLKMLPAPIHEVLQRVQDNADYMPASQRDSVMASNLGTEWRSLFSSFEDVPLAAASIGQVHKAVMASTGMTVAVKIQYPGVATSIDSDLNNLSILLTASRILPKGLFLDKTIANARTELAWETDYEREAAYQERFRELIADNSDVFTVPRIAKEVSGPQVLTAEFMSGTAVTKASLRLNQDQKDWIGTQILRLCLRELTEFSVMQTDPNWTNFLFNRESHKLELLDFGAAREFPEKFVDPYVSVLLAAARGDGARIRELSVELGYLTGHESKSMADAHVRSVLTLAEPFSERQDLDAVYDFRNQTITDRVRSFIPTMIRERLSPPPEETYSLHRKLSGAFLLLARLGSRVKCREMFASAIEDWRRRKGVSI